MPSRSFADEVHVAVASAYKKHPLANRSKAKHSSNDGIWNKSADVSAATTSDNWNKSNAPARASNNSWTSDNSWNKSNAPAQDRDTWPRSSASWSKKSDDDVVRKENSKWQERGNNSTW